MRVKFWGTRGSLPSPKTPQSVENCVRTLLREFLESGYSRPDDIDPFLATLPPHRLGGFGGNTTCVEVSTPQQRLVIDGGSGIRLLGYELLKGPLGRGEGELDLLLTHFHWDHLMGLPFFVPLFIPGNVIRVHAVQPFLPQVFQTLFKKPYFPVPLEKIGATIEYYHIKPREPIAFKDITVTPYQLDHPDPCWGFRFDCGGKSYAHCVDSEIQRVAPEELGPDLPLYQNVNLMAMDAQYTLLESVEKINWGHGSAAVGLEIALREGVDRVAFVHHDPASDDNKIACVEEQTRKFYNKQVKMLRDRGRLVREVEWMFASEGTTIEL